MTLRDAVSRLLLATAVFVAAACASKLPRTPQSFTLDAPPASASPPPGATRIVMLRPA
jgi:hypothetical protein